MHGVTTYNALRHSPAKAGDPVAVLGLGGLGHLGVQYAAKMGFRTVAIAQGQGKGGLGTEVGHMHISTANRKTRPGHFRSLGARKVILATATSGDAMSAVQGGLSENGTLLVIGAAESMQVSPLVLITGCRSVKGWYSGTAIDSQAALAFSVLAGVRSMNEVFRLDRVSEAYDHMLSGKARFRVVLTME